MNTAGVGGPITGKGAHLLLIDDPIKNAEEAYSKTMRDKAWEWYRSTAYTRLEPGGAIILTMTRWHQDDMAGRLIEEMNLGSGDKWEIINLPALAEANDPLGRQPGEPLWEERFPLKRLREIKAAIGTDWWNALYQQRPQAATGSIFKRQFFRYFSRGDHEFILQTPTGVKMVPNNKVMIFQTCDPAASTKTTADYFVLETWAKTPDNDLLLLDVIRTRLEGPDQPNLFKQNYERWHPSLQVVETNSMGLTLFQSLLRLGLPVHEVKAEVDKVIRAIPAAARMEAGTVYFMKGAPWLPDFEDELLAFNKGAHDDQVDCFSYAAYMLTNEIVDYNKDDVFLAGGGIF